MKQVVNKHKSNKLILCWRIINALQLCSCLVKQPNFGCLSALGHDIIKIIVIALQNRHEMS